MPYKDPEQRKAWYTATRLKNKQIVIDLKESTPCTDCGNKFPHYVTEYDHVPERMAIGEKPISVTKLAASRSLDAPTLQAEIAKCDLVCANCHKIRTYSRGDRVVRPGS